MSDSTFDFDGLLAQLQQTTNRDAAVRLGRLLLDHAFGEQDVMEFTEHTDRSIPTDDWNDEQRRVAVALAVCDAAWQEIGFFVQESLELPFEPTQADLRTALAEVHSPAEEEPATGEPTTEEVLEAVRRLVEVFPSGDRKIEAELKRFERIRPHAAIGVPMLVAQLQNGKTKQRTAAAWALGHVGPVARSAVPALLEALKDWKNESVPWALGKIGLDDYEPLLALMRSPDRDLADRAVEAFHDAERIPADLLDRLLSSPDKESRLLGVHKLRFAAAASQLPRLLQLLDDPEKDVAIQARYGLNDAGPSCIPTLFAEVPAASVPKRRRLAQVLANFEIDLTSHAVALAGWLVQEEHTGVRKELLNVLGRVTNPPAELVAAVGQLAQRKLKPEAAEHLLRTMGRLRAPEFVPAVIAQAESAEPRLRALALLTLRCFREPAATILACLERGLAADSLEVSLQAVWSLYHRGADAVPILVAKLNTANSERVKAEIAWALGLLGADSARPGLVYLRGEGAPLASSLAGWAIETLEAGSCG